MKRALPLIVAVVAGCAPYARPCNSDDDCLSGEVCAQGACALLVEREVRDPQPPAENAGGDDDERANAAPSLLVDAARVRAGTPTPLSLDVSDPDGDAVEVTVVTQPAHGSLEGDVYTAPEDFVGDDRLVLQPLDARGLAGAPVEVTVRVLPSDWIDVDLLRRARVSISQQAVTSTVTDLAVLVELDAAELGAEFLASARDVVRFVDDDGSVLPAELDGDATERLSFWVRPGDVDATAGLDGFFAYAGGATALPAPPARDVWNGYFGVWHFTDDRLADQPDSATQRTAENVNGNAEATRCRVGACFFFDGYHDLLRMRGSIPELAEARQVTLSGTIELASLKIGVVVGFSNGANLDVERVRLGVNASGLPTVRYATVDSATTSNELHIGPPLAVGSEVRLDAVVDLEQGVVTMYVDGVSVGSVFVPADAFPATASLRGTIGATTDDQPQGEIDGRVDEVRASLRARSADFVRVDAASRAGALTIVGPPEGG